MIKIGDLNSDGYDDILVGHHPVFSEDTLFYGITLLYNNGDGEFPNIEVYNNDYYGGQFVINDFNHNSVQDLAMITVQRESEPWEYYLTVVYEFGSDDEYVVQHQLEFIEYSTNIVKSLDYDNDSYTDIIIAVRGINDESSYCYVFKNNSGLIQFDHYFNLPRVNEIVPVDINDDSMMDFVVSGSSYINYQNLYLSNGSTFEDIGNIQIIEGQSGGYFSLVDIDGDNLLDLCAYNQTHLNAPKYTFVHRNIGGFTFHLIYTDIDYDTTFSFFTTSNIRNNDYALIYSDGDDYLNDYIYVSLYNGTDFNYVDQYYAVNPEPDNPSLPGRSSIVETSDINEDGFNDLVVLVDNVAWLEGGVKILFNDGTGHFLEEPLDVPYIIGDLDGNQILNVLDIILYISIILYGIYPVNDYYYAVDVILDGNVDILDIVNILASILN